MPQPSRRSPVLASFLAYLVPGLGHLYLGRWVRAGVFFGAISALFVLGVVMEARLAPPPAWWGDPLALLRSVAQMAIGLPYFLARTFGFEAGDIRAVTHEYGNTFTEAGGLLNILVILDAYDIAVGRKS